ncbi:MAG: nitrous oxide reductase family maturation protein NosD [Novosphingobium sp.]
MVDFESACAAISRQIATWFAVLCLSLICAPVQAQDSAAIYVSTRGDNRADGSSPSRALRTISAALARARPGQTVLIEGGTYREQVITVRGGRPGAQITLRSVNGIARVDGSGLKGRRDQNRGLIELHHPFVTLDGLAIVSSNSTGILLAASDLTVQNCHIADIQRHGISTETSFQTRAAGGGQMIKRIVLSGNTIEQTALAGNSQALSLIADGFRVSGNTIHNNRAEGIDIWLGSRRGEVTGNTVYANDAVGIYVDGAAYVSISGNRVYGNPSGIGISSEDARYGTHDIAVFNNVVYNNPKNAIFVWDDDRRPGIRGSQKVLIAHNTLIGSNYALYFAGDANSVEALNNLGLASGGNVQMGGGRGSSIRLGGNVWLASLTGFQGAERKDYHLAAQSPAIGKGVPLPAPGSYAIANLRLDLDFDGFARVSTGSGDAGAYAYVRN